MIQVASTSRVFHKLFAVTDQLSHAGVILSSMAASIYQLLKTIQLC